MSKTPFEEVKLTWDGQEVVIPSDQILGAIAVVEQVITLAELHLMAQNAGSFQLSRIATAYSRLLNYGGLDTSPDEVYVGMFAGGADMTEHVMSAVTGLIDLMIPKSARKAPASGETKGREGDQPKNEPNSSKNVTSS